MMQGRLGPPLTQPWDDVRKLMAKDGGAPNRYQDFYVACYLVWIIVTGAMFYAGMDLLLIFFTLTLAEVFLALAAFSTGSPFSQVGAMREIYVAMALEPMILLVAIGFFLEMDTYRVVDIFESSDMAILPLIGIFLGLVIILTMKLRKSPFDLSMSHHAHQDIVRGVATEFSGKTYAMMEVSHWYENIMLLGLVALFFQNGEWTGVLLGAIIAILVYLLEIWIDNGFARMKWQNALKTGWVVALILGIGNIAVLLVI